MWNGKKSIYSEKFRDPLGIFFTKEEFPALVAEKDDVSAILQGAIDRLAEEQVYGILYIPEGEYPIKSTVKIPQSVRLIGYGEKRPVFVLPKNTKGFDGLTAEDISPEAVAFLDGYPGANYMFWFIGDRNTKTENTKDANAGTFYSAISNIDFRIEEGNPYAVCIRAHFAQHGFVSHCHFDLGDGLAALFDVGNEMEVLTFEGGQYGMICRMTSPGWPFALLDSVFHGQKKAAILTGTTGFTGFRLHISDTPRAFDLYLSGAWEKLYLEDCIFENISEAAITFYQTESIIQQTNVRHVYCKGVPVFAKKEENGQVVNGAGEVYEVRDYTCGYVYSDGTKFCNITDSSLSGETVENMYETCGTNWSCEAAIREICDMHLLDKLPQMPASDIPPVPSMDTWVSVAKYGAKGDGVTDDTEALRDAVSKESILYFPQGVYKVTDTITLKRDITLIGLSPISTQIVIEDDTPAFASFGTPKAVVETAQGGHVYMNGIGIDTAGKNPRAVGVKWMADATSYMNDVKFVGGHGLMFRDGHNAYAYLYNASRTADYDPDRIWDYQYSSLWITNGGGGVFKDVWSASPYAEAGIAITDTDTPGKMYAISLEHHVRSEMKLYRVKNWSFYAIQTEEEKAEGLNCLPMELVSCENILFANFFLFRVVAVDRSYDVGIRLWDCRDIELLNVHNKAQMNYVFAVTLQHETDGFYAKSPEYARLYVSGQNIAGELLGEAKSAKNETKTEAGISEYDSVSGLSEAICISEYSAAPGKSDAPGKSEYSAAPGMESGYEIIAEGFDFAQGAVVDEEGRLYWCDKPDKRIYRYDPVKKRIMPFYDIHFTPSALALDTAGNLLVAVDHSELKKTIPGQPYLFHDAGNPHPFFAWFHKRGEKVYAVSLKDPYNTMTELKKIPAEECNPKVVYRPAHLSYHGMLREIVENPIKKYYMAPDGITAVEGTIDLARSLVLTQVKAGETYYIMDDYLRKLYSFKVTDGGNLADGECLGNRGQYSVYPDNKGILWTIDDKLYGFKDGVIVASRNIPKDAYAVVGNGNKTYIMGRGRIYIGPEL